MENPTADTRLALDMLAGGRAYRHGVRGAIIALVVAGGLSLACRPVLQSTLPGAPTPAQLAQLWIQPERPRDLYWGVGGKRLAPDPSAPYTVIEIKRSGFSQGYTVEDKQGRQWSAKFPPEAATEIVASRIHWGIGYHQPPIYLLTDWTARKATSPNPQLPSRFRESKPDLHGLDAKGTWSVLPQSLRGHAPAPGPPRAPGHARQLRPEGR